MSHFFRNPGPSKNKFASTPAKIKGTAAMHLTTIPRTQAGGEEEHARNRTARNPGEGKPEFAPCMVLGECFPWPALGRCPWPGLGMSPRAGLPAQAATPQSVRKQCGGGGGARDQLATAKQTSGHWPATPKVLMTPLPVDGCVAVELAWPGLGRPSRTRGLAGSTRLAGCRSQTDVRPLACNPQGAHDTPTR